jgi:ribonuclease Z
MNIEIFSVGGYSSWCYYAPDRILFDCGEGFATNLRNRVFAVDKVVLGHSHGDHINGLFQLLAARDSARGDKDKALEILCDIDNEYVKKYIDFLQFTNFRAFRNYKTVFNRVMNAKLCEGKRYLHPFLVEHSPKFMCLGFSLREHRSRLKEKYRGLDIKSLLANGQAQKDDLMEYYWANKFVYSLDSSSFDIGEIRGAEHWVADCTFLKREDMDGDSTHMCLEDVLAIRERAKIKNIYLAHISSRYSNDDIKKLVLPEGVFPVYHGRVNRFD